MSGEKPGPTLEEIEEVEDNTGLARQEAQDLININFQKDFPLKRQKWQNSEMEEKFSNSFTKWREEQIEPRSILQIQLAELFYQKGRDPRIKQGDLKDYYNQFCSALVSGNPVNNLPSEYEGALLGIVLNRQTGALNLGHFLSKFASTEGVSVKNIIEDHKDLLSMARQHLGDDDRVATKKLDEFLAENGFAFLSEADNNPRTESVKTEPAIMQDKNVELARKPNLKLPETRGNEWLEHHRDALREILNKNKATFARSAALTTLGTSWLGPLSWVASPLLINEFNKAIEECTEEELVCISNLQNKK